jgi:Uma2 family endonuclease
MKKPKLYPTEESRLLPSTVEEIDYSASYSYADYMRFKFEDRLEIIKGKIFLMGAPFRIHQKIFGMIFNKFYNFLEGHKCEVYGAPFDVRLPINSKKDKDIFTVVQPDIVVVCDPTKLDKRGCIGAPDLVVEILSPGNSKKERIYKFEAYEENGVKEYWIVDPDKKACLKYLLNDNGKFEDLGPIGIDEHITSSILPSFSLNLKTIFDT